MKQFIIIPILLIFYYATLIIVLNLPIFDLAMSPSWYFLGVVTALALPLHILINDTSVKFWPTVFIVSLAQLFIAKNSINIAFINEQYQSFIACGSAFMLSAMIVRYNELKVNRTTELLNITWVIIAHFSLLTFLYYFL